MIKTVIARQSKMKSVLEVSKAVVELVADLSEVDRTFSKVQVFSAGINGCRFEAQLGLEPQEREKIARKLASDLVEHERADSARLDKEPNPTLHFQRPIGFGSFLSFGDKEPAITGNFGLGSSLTTIFNINYIAKESEKYFTLEWYEKIIKCMVNHFDPVYSSLLFSGMEFYDEQKEMKLPEALGWITYIKNEAEILVPDALPDAVIEEHSNGKLVVLSRDEGHFHNLSHEAKLDKLLTNMKQLIAII